MRVVIADMSIEFENSQMQSGVVDNRLAAFYAAAVAVEKARAARPLAPIVPPPIQVPAFPGVPSPPPWTLTCDNQTQTEVKP